MSTKWPTVVAAMIVVQKADEQLKGLLGGEHIYRAKSTPKIQVPGVYYTVLSDETGENTHNVTVQWDVWGKSAEHAAQIEARLYALMHRDTDDIFNGVPMCSRIVQNTTIDDEIDNRIHREMTFSYEIGRDL